MEPMKLHFLTYRHNSLKNNNLPVFEFHISNECRKKYEFEETLFSQTGDLIIANFGQARLLAEKINSKRKDEGNFDQLITAGQLNGLGILHEIFHYIIRIYEEKTNPGVIKRSLEHLRLNLGEQELEKVLLDFTTKFSPLSVYKEEFTAENYLNNKTGKKSNKEIILEEMFLLFLENINPATVMLSELYSDKQLSSVSLYEKLIDQTEKFFLTEKPFGKENISLFQFLKNPIISNPYNLELQLEFIINNWGNYIYEKFNLKLLKGRDLIREDIKIYLQHGGGEKATPPVPVYDLDQDYFDKLKKKFESGEKLSDDESRFYHAEVEKFTEDTDWMPRVVMIAKNIFVWLDQLSKKYQSPISRLDQIPNEELDQLARWNFSALWLIGIWERSPASRKIKQLTGNPEAAASAYSLYDYEIAAELGGEEAFQNLKMRAGHRGIRLASDMVPNHTGIFSRWILENPDFYIQASVPPYPGYSFTGPDLSDDNRISVRIEDKYYSRNDAAVVFERIDRFTGDTRYIYHGNDGTNMPWNDTAQLNLLKSEVREALIEMIKHVARKTPIIRFDAAMTLAKQHFQRLWYPVPGTGGAIPSRSDYSMTREQFDKAIPKEFWREVVDRMNEEMPNVLLLAEAFWLMEGYFVRSLGMHRVYNSAFMHMMMKEENEKYRLLIRNTLEFTPQILKRYVNFMSNPDEETAVNQFGKGDKYFGVSVMMLTLPGLPMFGHGQVEGYSEKYGMEYKRAYYNEQPDGYLVSRHEQEIFPLMKLRHLFSQVDNFQLYDLVDDNGFVNDNVFAFTNSHGNEKALVVYNNAYRQATGTMNVSAKKAAAAGQQGEMKIAKALGLKSGNRFFYIFTDHRTKLQYIVRGRDIHESGFYVFLNGYEYKCLVNWEEKNDTNGRYEKVYEMLGGKGTHSIEDLLVEMEYSSVNSALIKLLSTENLRKLSTYVFEQDKDKKKKASGDKITPESILKNELEEVMKEFSGLNNFTPDNEKVLKSVLKTLKTLRQSAGYWQEKLSAKRKAKWLTEAERFSYFGKDGKDNDPQLMLLTIILERILNNIEKSGVSVKTLDDLVHPKVVTNILNRLNRRKDSIDNDLNLLRILTNSSIKKIWRSKSTFRSLGDKKLLKADLKKFEADIISALFINDDVIKYAGVNEFQGTTYFNKESFEKLLRLMFSLSLSHSYYEVKKKKTKSKSDKKSKKKSGSGKKIKSTSPEPIQKIKESFTIYNNLNKESDKVGFDLTKLKTYYEEKPERKASSKSRKKSETKKKTKTKKRGVI